MLQFLKIPARRIPALLGKKGAVKKRIESSTKTRLKVQRSGEVEIDGEPEGQLTAMEIVKAIGRGFPPEKAMELLDENRQLSVISLQGQTEKTIKRLLSRVIGQQGRAKRNIERLTGASIRISGKTVSILGDSQALDMACTAVEDLLAGRTHAFVYSKLEKMKRLNH
jgi:ribosomal RNA assembly protein